MPSVTPVTSPLVVTVATAGVLDAHVTTRPVSTFPFASLSVPTSCRVAPTSTHGFAGVMLTDATGAVDAAVTPVATFDSSPNTAPLLSLPRNATSSKLYVVPAARPRTVQVRLAPMAWPASGVAHVPRLTLVAFAPQVSVVPAA